MTAEIFMVIHPLKEPATLYNMHFAMENRKSFVIVLLQSQILWQWKNAVGVINLEKLFVDPCSRRMHAFLKMAQLLLLQRHSGSAGHKKVVSWLCGLTEGRICFVASSSAQRNCGRRTETGKGNRLFLRLRTELCMKQREKKIRIFTHLYQHFCRERVWIE